ncbi:unnamed protein product [Clonostachys byssicola]|uniref:Uncharacterized protein n=1 Tax=Clonostachys byssicola TaxID=160290 RepID=A0A9N9U3H9_9HYPO|nr:unnamed protein product [Clonostachys byssicola]
MARAGKVANKQAEDKAEDTTKLPVRTKGEKSSSSASAASAPGHLTVFDDEDDEDEVISAKPAVEAKEPAAAPPQDEDESDSDDDEAPEAISTHQAASNLKKSAQAAQKASQEQAAAQKRKRQERDALFKQQAEERKKTQEITKPAETQDSDSQDVAGPSSNIVSSRRIRGDKIQIPAILPDEFLTDSSSDEEEDHRHDLEVAMGPKRRKVASVERTLTRLDRGPRDETVGSTVYRVASKNDQRLAPKAKKYTKSAKDVLLRRNRTAVPSRGGFFKK